MNKYLKFGALIVVVLGTILWMATAGVEEKSTYFKTIPELQQMGSQAQVKRLKLQGYVESNSIVRKAGEVEFVLRENYDAHPGAAQTVDVKKVKVVYAGIEPLPDTFKDGAEALAEGKMGPDGVFRAGKIQAKCASKYAPKTPGAGGAGQSYEKPPKTS